MYFTVLPVKIGTSDARVVEVCVTVSYFRIVEPRAYSISL